MATERTMPKRLGKYELHGILGKGAMGVVYDAWDPGIERRVAVKTIRLPDSGDNTAEEEYGRFKREAQAAGRLSHPGIVGVYDSGEADGIAYIAMELVEGQSLKALMDAQHRLTPPDAVRLMRELLDALAYSHASGVIHRDIKPTNILVTPQGRLKITDFGIARIESSSMTQIGIVMGTPAYMSPEQFMGQTVDQRTDIYAAGVLLFQLLTGERPFEGGLTAIMHKVLHTVPPKPSELSVTAPESFDPVVAKAMALRPEDRYPNAKAFDAALTQALAGGPALHLDRDEEDTDETLVAPVQRQRPAPAHTPPKTPSITAAQKKKEKKKQLPVAILVGVAAGFIVIGAGSYWLLRPGAKQLEQQSTIVAASPPASSAPATAMVEQTPAAPPPAAEPAPPQPASPPAAAPTFGTAAAPSPSMPDIPAPPQPQAPELIQPQPTPLQPAPLPSVAASDPAPPPSLAPEAGTQAQKAAVANVACTLLDVTAGGDNRTVVSGLVGTGSPESAARAALATAGATAPKTSWATTRFDGPYCPVVDVLRTVRSANGLEFDLGLRGSRTRLRNGETMAPVITAPSLPAYLQLAYFQSNRVVVHLFPVAGPQEKALTPGQAVHVGDPRTGGWPVGDPFGADMMVAIMSSAPLPARPMEESSDAYLAALERAAQQITRDGGTISVRAVPIQTYK